MALTHLEPRHWWRWRSWRWPSARSVGRRTEVSSSAGRALWGSRGPAPPRPRILTQQQQMSTMRRACSTPAVPTIQVSRRNRITPKMFCRQGRYTPMRVPMLGAYGAGGEGGDGASEGPLIAWLSPTSRVFSQRTGWRRTSQMETWGYRERADWISVLTFIH